MKINVHFNLIGKLIICITLIVLSSTALFSEESVPAWYKEWINDTIHLKVDQYFWLPESAQINDDLIKDIRSYVPHLKKIVPKYSFQEFSYGNIKWVSLVKEAGTTDPIYMININGEWKIVLDEHRHKIPFPDKGIEKIMKNMFNLLEKENVNFIKDKK